MSNALPKLGIFENELIQCVEVLVHQLPRSLLLVILAKEQFGNFNHHDQKH